MQKNPEEKSVRTRGLGALVVGLVATATGSFILPQLPGDLQAPIGITGGLLIIVAAFFYLLLVLHDALSIRLLTLSTDLPVFFFNSEKGTLTKTGIRNVSLRVGTAHRIVDALTAEIPTTRRRAVLTQVGRSVGETWGREFRKEYDLRDLNRKPLGERLGIWSEYDASAGFGRFQFNIREDGTGTVFLKNGFLDEGSSSSIPLDYFFVGYLEGAMHQIVGPSVTVRLADSGGHDHTAAFFVEARKRGRSAGKARPKSASPTVRGKVRQQKSAPNSTRQSR